MLLVQRRGKSGQWAIDDAIVLACGIGVASFFLITLPAFEQMGNSVAFWHIGGVSALRNSLLLVPVLAFAFSEPLGLNRAVALMGAFGVVAASSMMYLYSGTIALPESVRVVTFLLLGGAQVVLAIIANTPEPDSIFEPVAEGRVQWNLGRIGTLVLACFAPLVVLIRNESIYVRYPTATVLGLVILLIAMIWRLQRSILVSHRAMIELRDFAERDPLTGLFNRRFLYTTFLGDLARGLEASNTSALACCYIDLDNLKDINDRMEHAVGDKAIVAVADALRWVQSGRDGCVARMGGDEFAVFTLLNENAEAESAAIADAIRYAVNRDSAGGIAVRASVGSSWARLEQGKEPLSRQLDRLLSETDLAQVHAKRTGGARLIRYDANLGENARRVRLIQRALPEAWARGEISLAYQPVVDLRNGALLGAEALMRWSNPHLGQVPPDEAIRIACDIGLECELGLDITRQALTDIATEIPVGPLRIGINLCASQLRPQAVEALVERIKESGHASRIWLEVTEQTLVDERAYAGGALADLRSQGALIAIDDFGTGYCGLDYLCTLPIDLVKLDKVFAREIETSEIRRKVTLLSVQLADAVGARVIAEGIETANAAAIMREIGCHFGQGYFFKRPVPSIAEAIAAPPQWASP